VTISSKSQQAHILYKVADHFVKDLKRGFLLNELKNRSRELIITSPMREEGDFVIDEKESLATLTLNGARKAEQYFMVDTIEDSDYKYLLYYINNALRANYIMNLNIDYIISNDKVIIVDTFTGRLQPGNRFSNGLHQAIEAKENVWINPENKTDGVITIQNFFKKYKRKAGMTGTAQTSEKEFKQVYGMNIVIVPTNKPMIREDHHDEVYLNESSKYNGVVQEVINSYEKGQPVLVGTTSIAKSELVSRLLTENGIEHRVLNALNHEQESAIIAQAGQANAVTVVTNMAGRGTDIVLGEGVAEIGGLKVIGTERHEARRIDNQLRGRAGRQGDPGESIFFLSMEDELMRRFGGEKLYSVL